MQSVRACARARVFVRVRMRVCLTGKMSVRRDVKEDALRANLMNSDHTVKWIIYNSLKSLIFLSEIISVI
jgi:hypothetical protein